MDSWDPLAGCPVCSWHVPADTAAAADEIGVVYDPDRDEVVIVGRRLGRLHSCQAETLPRDADGQPVRP